MKDKKFFSGKYGSLLLGLLLVAGWRAEAQQPADLILHNGKILTVDEQFSTAEAVAVRGGRFVAVGRNADVMRLSGPSTRVIDLQGRTVVPGLVDTHRHMYSYSERAYGDGLDPDQLRRYPIDWRGVNSTDDVLTQMRGIMEKYKFPPGKWIYFANRLGFIRGGSVDQAKIIMDDLNRWELDKVTPDNPVAMSLGIPDFNGFLLNSKAMEIIWDKNKDFIERNGRYWVNAQGEPDGHVEPPASRLVLPFTYDRAPEVLASMYKKDLGELASMGITTLSTRMPTDSMEAYRWLERRGELTLRIGVGDLNYFGTVTNLESGMKEAQAKVGTGDDMVWITSVAPTAVDGATSRACTDLQRDEQWSTLDSWFPVGQCHMDMEYKGSPRRAAPISENYYRDWIVATAREGGRLANTHVAGDRGVKLMLDTMEQVQKQYGPEATKGWAMDHCSLVNPADFPRAAKLGVTMSCYPAVSVEGAQKVAEAYGEKVAHTYPSPVKSMLDAGVKVVFETDRNSYVWADLEKVVTRKDNNGKVWGPQERLDRPTTLKTVTRWAAEYVLKSDKLGSIETGKLADLLVLDRDFMTVPEEEIGEIQPQLTVLGGKIIFVHSSFAQANNLRPDGALVSTYKDLVAQRPSQATRAGQGM